jgi:spermidine synthase
MDDLPLLAKRNPRIALFLASVTSLYLEMLVIRWISTEVRIFAYLQNTILVTCFLGLGLGFLFCRRNLDLRAGFVWLLALTTVLAVPLSRWVLTYITTLLAGLSKQVGWTSPEAATAVLPIVAGLALTLSVMVAIALVFFPIGQLIGRLMDDDPRIMTAYSLNVGASLLGIWLFVALSAGSSGPAVWGLVLVALVSPLLFRDGSARDTALTATVLVALGGSFVAAESLDRATETVWSPYQKLAVQSELFDDGTLRYHAIQVNTTSEFQKMRDLDPATASPRVQPRALFGLSQYDLPSRLHGDARKVLLVGAGSGNDAAGALRQGATDVTAVDIDPAIVMLGRRWHPNHPYDNPAVRVVIDDARSFFATTPETYDVVVFGLLDAHTTTAMTNARLDHYVYTTESIRQAARLLKPDGLLVLSFAVQFPYVGDRMARVLTDTFGERPMVMRFPNDDFGHAATVFVAGDLERVQRTLATDVPLGRRVAELQAATPLSFPLTTRVATDDWPYLYLEKPGVPLLFALLAALLPCVLWIVTAVRGLPSLRSAWRAEHWHFFLLGAAFLLLEVQNISKASVILGNTWQVSAIVVSGVLTLVLVANFVVARFPNLPTWPVVVALVASCLGLYGVDLATFAFWPYAAKALVVGCLISLPMAFSGIVFARSLVAVEDKDQALGANLLGSLCGALIQSLTFLTGIKALLLIVAVLYLGAALTRPRAKSAPMARADGARAVA